MIMSMAPQVIHLWVQTPSQLSLSLPRSEIVMVHGTSGEERKRKKRQDSWEGGRGKERKKEREKEEREKDTERERKQKGKNPPPNSPHFTGTAVEEASLSVETIYTLSEASPPLLCSWPPLEARGQREGSGEEGRAEPAAPVCPLLPPG